MFGQYALHRLTYHDVRAGSGLAAQMVVRLLAKVADAYKLDQKRPRVFRRRMAASPTMTVSWRYGTDHVSLWTLRPAARSLRGGARASPCWPPQGESDLVYRAGKWYLSHRTI